MPVVCSRSCKLLREDHKLFGADLQTELTEILDKLGFHLGSTAKQVPTHDIVQVLKVVERVLVDGSEQQKWAVTHFLMTSLQSSIKAQGSGPTRCCRTSGPPPRPGGMISHRIRRPRRTGS